MGRMLDGLSWAHGSASSVKTRSDGQNLAPPSFKLPGARCHGRGPTTMSTNWMMAADVTSSMNAVGRTVLYDVRERGTRREHSGRAVRFE